jgi:hypothetical protein
MIIADLAAIWSRRRWGLWAIVVANYRIADEIYPFLR